MAADIAASRAPEDIPVFNRILLESPVGSEISLEGIRDGEPMTWKVTSTKREPAEPREKELLSWGITARDLTELNAKEMPPRRQQGGARPKHPPRRRAPPPPSRRFHPATCILEVAGKPTPDLAELIRVSNEITEGKTEPVPVLVSYERDGRSYLTVVKIGPEPEVDKPGLVKKAWIGIDTQVISADLAEALGIPDRRALGSPRCIPAPAPRRPG